MSKAWELIADPKRWVKNDYAVDETGEEVGVHDPTACAWCAIGAVSKCYGEPGRFSPIAEKIFKVYQDRYGVPITEDNDLEEMTAAKMSERLRVVEESVLASIELPAV